MYIQNKYCMYAALFGCVASLNAPIKLERHDVIIDIFQYAMYL